jgi:hypothetical protein
MAATPVFEPSTVTPQDATPRLCGDRLAQVKGGQACGCYAREGASSFAPPALRGLLQLAVGIDDELLLDPGTELPVGFRCILLTLPLSQGRAKLEISCCIVAVSAGAEPVRGSSTSVVVVVMNSMGASIDVILTPAAPGGAVELGATGDPCFNRLASMLGLPAITLPFALDPNGLPLRLQFIGRKHQDDTLLATALHVQKLIAFVPHQPQNLG